MGERSVRVSHLGGVLALLHRGAAVVRGVQQLAGEALAVGRELRVERPELPLVDTDAAARVYARLGFVEVDGFEVFVDLA